MCYIIVDFKNLCVTLLWILSIYVLHYCDFKDLCVTLLWILRIYVLHYCGF